MPVSSSTLILIVIALQQGLFAGLWALAAVAGMSRRAALHWSAGMLVVALGMMLVVQRDQVPVWLGWWVANTCVVVGLVLFRRGIERFAGTSPADVEHVLVCVVTAVLTALATRAGSVWALACVVSLVAGTVLLRTALCVVRDLAGAAGRGVSLASAAPLGLLGSLLIARGVLALLQPERFGQALTATNALSVSVVLGIVASGLLVNFSLAGLVVARMVGELRHYSDHDALTGLLNRRGIEQRLRAERQRLIRHGSPYSLLSLDLDHFKRVNDQHGHPVGDEVLRAIGEILRRVGRGADSAGRVGGEEFWFLLPDTDLVGALPLADRILREARALRLPGSEELVQITVSIGVAAATDRTESDESLMRRLDEALYRAKTNGRDRLEIAAHA